MLCNPVTRDFSRLINNCPYSLDGYGFGYDGVSDDYKIVNIQFREIEEEEEKYFVEVVYYSTSSNAWKQYHQSRYSCWAYEDKGEVVNNKLHWIIQSVNCDNKHIRDYNILTFDLHTEEFGDITLSTHLQQLFENCRRPFLMVSIDGRLFFVATLLSHPYTTEIWVYGGAESWMMCYEINAREFPYERFKVISYRTREDGDEVLLLLTNVYIGTKQLGWYNIENKSFRLVDGNRYMGKSWPCKATLAPIPVTNLS